MPDDTFAEALLHARAPFHARVRGFSAHVVLGRRLRPFAAWHALLLDAIRSPFAGHAGPVDLARLDLAVRACQADFRCAPRLPRFPRAAACLLQYRFGRHESREMQRFRDYARDYKQGAMPIFGERPNEEPAAQKLPWYLALVTRLRACDPSLSMRAAWMMPVAEAVWLALAAGAAHGEADLSAMLDDEDRAAFAEAGVELPN